MENCRIHKKYTFVDDKIEVTFSLVQKRQLKLGLEYNMLYLRHENSPLINHEMNQMSIYVKQLSKGKFVYIVTDSVARLEEWLCAILTLTNVHTNDMLGEKIIIIMNLRTHTP